MLLTTVDSKEECTFLKKRLRSSFEFLILFSQDQRPTPGDIHLQWTYLRRSLQFPPTSSIVLQCWQRLTYVKCLLFCFFFFVFLRLIEEQVLLRVTICRGSPLRRRVCKSGECGSGVVTSLLSRCPGFSIGKSWIEKSMLDKGTKSRRRVSRLERGRGTMGPKRIPTRWWEQWQRK